MEYPPALTTKIPPSFFDISRMDYQSFCRRDGPKNVIAVFERHDSDQWAMFKSFVEMAIHNKILSFVTCTSKTSSTVSVWSGEEDGYMEEPSERVKTEILSQIDRALSYPLEDMHAEKQPIPNKTKHAIMVFAKEVARYLDMHMFVDMTNLMFGMDIKVYDYDKEDGNALKHSINKARTVLMEYIMICIYNHTKKDSSKKQLKNFLKEVDKIKESRMLDELLCKLAREEHGDVMGASELYELYKEEGDDEFVSLTKFSKHLNAHNVMSEDNNISCVRKVFVVDGKDRVTKSNKYRVDNDRLDSFVKSVQKKNKVYDEEGKRIRLKMARAIAKAGEIADKLIAAYKYYDGDMERCNDDAPFVVELFLSSVEKEYKALCIEQVAKILFEHGLVFEYDIECRVATLFEYE